MENNNLDSFLKAKHYYEQLDLSCIEELTLERWEEIDRFSKAYYSLNIANEYLHYYSLDEMFSIVIQKLIASKNNVLQLSRFNSINYDSDTISVSIELKNDAEKILFIENIVDPKHTAYARWETIVSKLKVDDCLSPSNYLRARKIMEAYYGKFFVHKFFENTPILKNHYSKLVEQQVKSHK